MQLFVLQEVFNRFALALARKTWKLQVTTVCSWYSLNKRMMTQHAPKLDIDPMNSRHGALETFF